MYYYASVLTGFMEGAAGWGRAHGIKIIAIVIGAWLVRRFSSIVIENIIRRAVPPDHFLSKEAEKKREDTLIHIVNSTVRVLVWLIAGMMILSEAGVDIGPMLAAAGIAGIALGFGGQYLIRDIISGIFVIFENQYRVGDVVCFDTTCGLVESVSLRITVLRDLDGTVHHVPHGEIKKVSNLSKSYARVNLNVGIAYDSDLEKVIKTVNRVGNELTEDEAWKEKIITPPQFLRVDKFGDSAIEIKILGDTKPIEQWAVAGELRKRLKIAFDKEGIVIPFPQRVVHMINQQ